MRRLGRKAYKSGISQQTHNSQRHELLSDLVDDINYNSVIESYFLSLRRRRTPREHEQRRDSMRLLKEVLRVYDSRMDMEFPCECKCKKHKSFRKRT